MFRPKQDADQTRIKLPRRSLPPTKDYLQFAFVQAFQYREKEVEITWTSYGANKLFTLVVKAEREKNIPLWTLWEESKEGSQFIWSGETSDLESVEKKLSDLDPLNQDLADTAQKPAKQDSPYRKMFSSSYHGIRPPVQNSIRDSFSRLRPVFPPTTSSNNPIVTKESGQNQATPVPSVIPEEAAPPKVILDNSAPAVALCKNVLNELTKLAGGNRVPTVHAVAENLISGTLEHTNIQNKQLIKIIANQKWSGRLELVNQEEGKAQIIFVDGQPVSASLVVLDDQLIEIDLTAREEIKGDKALLEVMIWSASGFKFFVYEEPSEQNITVEWEQLSSAASNLTDQFIRLKNAGLKDRSVMVKKQDNLGDVELRLLLSKHNEGDTSEEAALYKRLSKKFTVADFFDGGPIIKSVWIPLVYSFYTNGLIDIKPPMAINESSLNFMEEGKAAVQGLKTSFIRQESGVLTYPALLYFLQYEYLRYQAYDWPLSLIIFEMSKTSNNAIGGLDLINKQETAVALSRIGAIKRPLDLLGHFEAINYALLLPNTNIITANQIAKNVIKTLTAQPLMIGLDPNFLKLSFGIGCIPTDCEDIESLIVLGKKALQQAKGGDFQIVQASTVK